VGPVNDTDTDELPRAADTIVGGFGTAAATNVVVAPEGRPVPTAFTAAIVHEYDFPIVSPDTTTGLDPAGAIRVAPPFEETHDAM
jgi:hypothetical protein